MKKMTRQFTLVEMANWQWHGHTCIQRRGRARGRHKRERVIVSGMSFAAPLNEMSETNFRQQSRKEGRRVVGVRAVAVRVGPWEAGEESPIHD